MSKKAHRTPQAHTTLPFEVRAAVEHLGERIRIARVRRRLEQDELAQAVGTSRRTIWSIESGKPGVAIGTVLAVLWKLGLMGAVEAVADPDADDHGKTLEAARRPQRVHSDSAGLDNDF